MIVMNNGNINAFNDDNDDNLNHQHCSTVIIIHIVLSITDSIIIIRTSGIATICTITLKSHYR